MEPPIPYPTLQAWKQEIRSTDDPFIKKLPKIELHVHLEGTLTPELRWKLAQQHNLPLHSARLNKTFHSLEELNEAYDLLQPRSIKGKGLSAFFEAYYGGMEVLQTQEDFYELAMAYFLRARDMGVVYCEVMFDVQAHTRRGVEIGVLMAGLKGAREEAEMALGVSSPRIGTRVEGILELMTDENR
jgi:adenosine deaminase